MPAQTRLIMFYLHRVVRSIIMIMPAQTRLIMFYLHRVVRSIIMIMPAQTRLIMFCEMRNNLCCCVL